MSKQLTIGILAHVDAGKTTLSEAMLYSAGAIRKLGRVDKGDSFLDNYEIEKNRGITVFSKQAELNWKDVNITILDTPGHDDFSAEMERALDVIDYALLVVSGVDGPQSHTETVWRLLRAREIPTFVFINKMDLAIADRGEQIKRLFDTLGEGFVDFSPSPEDEGFIDEVTLYAPELADYYLENMELSEQSIKDAIRACSIYPCLFGSALHQDGVDRLLDSIAGYAYGYSELHTDSSEDAAEPGAFVYKIARDQRDERLSFVKVITGTLHVKDSVSVITDSGEPITEKINQIRIYSGQKYLPVQSASAGQICAATGISSSKAGTGIGSLAAQDMSDGVIEPFLTYRIIPADDIDQNRFVADMLQLEVLS